MTKLRFVLITILVVLLAILVYVRFIASAPDNMGFVNSCLMIGEGPDQDSDIVQVSVTGTPTIAWDESADSFTITHPVVITGIADGGLTSYDLKVGDPDDYGMIKFGDAAIGRTSFNSGNADFNGTVVIRNLGGPVTGQIEFIFSESAGGTTRFALPKAGVGNATYNPRSMFVGPGPAPNNDDMVTLARWQGLGWFHNIDCDTVGTGADLGVQDDVEVEGDIYTDSIKESTPGAGVAFDSLIIPSGTTPAPDIAGAIFLDTNESVNGSLMVYGNGAWRKVADLP